MPDIGEFTTKAADGPITFRLDGIECRAVATLPAETFAKFMHVANRLTRISSTISAKDIKPETMEEAFVQFISASLEGLDLVLFEDSAAMLAERVRSREHPLSIEELSLLFAKLAEVYTGAADESAASSDDDAAPFDDANASPLS